jgi:hypothetical protein
MASDYNEITKYNEEQLGKDTASRKSQVNMYSDFSHFVYEILQNADDYGASMVSFILDEAKLTIDHDGSPFTEENVRAISYFGKSTSREDLVKTGRFGLGFKSVFAFTASPSIHSGQEDFKIYDLYRLKGLKKPPGVSPQTTRIILPFNHMDLEPDYVEVHVEKEKAFEKISKRLQKLDLTTLLFTRNILEIKWAVIARNGSTQGHYKRSDSETIKNNYTKNFCWFRKTEITDGQNNHVYLVYTSPVVWENDQHKPVDIAFYSDVNDSDIIIQSLKKPLFVLFPTTVETHMDFLINGPFRTPAHRETVAQEDEFNQFLIQKIGDLLCKAMVDIKSKGLFTVNFLNLLPIKTEYFPKDTMFYSIYEAVRHFCKNEEFLPTSDGSHVSAKNAKLARGADLITLLSSMQLQILYAASNELKWLSDVITHSMPALHKYLKDELLVEELTASSFAQKLSASFLSKQSDEWMIDFYKFVSNKPDLWKRSDSLLRKREIIRLENGNHVKPFTEDGNPYAYLPTSSATNFPTVKKSIVADNEALDFLKRLDIIEIDLFAELLEFILPKYAEKNVKIDLLTNIEDLRKVIAAKNAPQEADNKNNLNLCKIFLKKSGIQGLVELVDSQPEIFEKINPSDFLGIFLRKIELIQAVNNHTRKIAYKFMDDVYFKTPEMAVYFEDNENCWFINDEYPEDIISLFRQYKIPSEPRIQEKYADSEGHVIIKAWKGHHERGLDGFDPNFEVDGLEHAIHNCSHEKSRYIWNTIAINNYSQINGFIETASRQSYAGSKKKKVFSKFGKLLTNFAWLPDKKGFYHKPVDLFLDELSDEFEKNTPTAKGLSIALSMKQPENERYLESLTGGDPERTNLIKRIIAASDTELAKIKKIFPAELPSQPVPRFREGLRDLPRQQKGAIDNKNHENFPVKDTNRYMGRLGEEVESAVNNHQSKMQTISFKQIRKIPSNKDARVFLYSEYNGHCQISGTTFPKASKDINGNSNNYFQACSLLSYANAEYYNDAGNMLCVSADTMAKLKFANFEFIDSIDDAIELFKLNDGLDRKIIVKIRLSGEECAITWSQRHFMRLVALYDNA